MSRNVRLYVRDIPENMRDAEEFIQGMSAQSGADLASTSQALEVKRGGNGRADGGFRLTSREASYSVNIRALSSRTASRR